MTRDAFGAVAERPSRLEAVASVTFVFTAIFSALMQTDDAEEAVVPVLGFLQTTISHISKWEAWLPSSWEWSQMRG